MALISVPCPKCFTAAPRNGEGSRSSNQSVGPLGLISKPEAASPFPASSARFPRRQASNSSLFHTLKAQIQEVALESASNSSPLTSTKAEPLSTNTAYAPSVVESKEAAAVPDSKMLAFLSEAKNLVNFVDSKDIAELQLKRDDFELIIRKKEALPQPAINISPPLLYPQAMLPYQHPVAQTAPPPPTSAAAASPALALPPPANAGNKSSLPTLKCPMAGTFYRSSAPGDSPFIKVGDRIQKGQVVCIIEAMKLMNEIEADQSGTVVEIVAENGKPVSVDMPLMIIQP